MNKQNKNIPNRKILLVLLCFFFIGIVIAVPIITITDNDNFDNFTRGDKDTLEELDATDISSIEDIFYEKAIRQFKSNNLTSRQNVGFKIEIEPYLMVCSSWNVSDVGTGVNTLEDNEDFDRELYFVFCENEIRVNKSISEMDIEFDNKRDAYLKEYAQNERDRKARREAVNIPVRSGTMVNG